VIACPECGTRAPGDVVPGATYARPSCGNPVLARTLPDAPRDSLSIPAPPRRFPWRAAAAAFVVLGGAYLGTYSLLTAESKRQRASLEGAYGPALLTAEEPPPLPPGATPAQMRERQPKQQMYEDRLRYEKLGSRIDVFFYAMLAAFAAQTLFTALLALKARQAKASAPPSGRSRRA